MAQKKLLEYALKLISRRRYTEKNLRQKLRIQQSKLEHRKKSGGLEDNVSLKIEKIDPEERTETKKNEEVDEAVRRLIEYGYLNDSEYVKVFTSSELARAPQSLRLITQRLIQKGIKKELINQALAQININESELARKAVEKKLKILKKLTPEKQKEKLYRFLLSRGFSLSTIYSVLKDSL